MVSVHMHGKFGRKGAIVHTFALLGFLILLEGADGVAASFGALMLVCCLLWGLEGILCGLCEASEGFLIMVVGSDMLVDELCFGRLLLDCSRAWLRPAFILQGMCQSLLCSAQVICRM